MSAIDHGALQSLTPAEAAAVGAVFDRMFPADEHGPGAVEIGAVTYLDCALNGAYAELRETYRLGLAALDRACVALHGAPLAALDAATQDMVIADMEARRLPGFAVPDQWRLWDLMRAHMQEGVFADPSYGGNRGCAGWRAIGHPGVWLENSAEENLAAEPVTKGGRTQSLADVAEALRADTSPDPELPGYDPQRSVEPPSGPVDVVLVGVGAVGGLIAPILAEAGLRVVGLEAGPIRSLADYVPDELGATYYCRQNLGPKFIAEEIRWRRNAGEPTQEPGYSLGRMMNGAGGSVVHYGAWLRRFHPHHLRYRSHIEERWGKGVIPEGCTVADWPVTYDELEPYFSRLDREVGVAGDDGNPFLRRSAAYPLPPLRPFRMGEIFTEATRGMGLHPHPVPVGMNSAPYNGFPETTYCAWNNGFGAWRGDKWHPGLTSIPRALASGNFELRTGCRVTRVETDADGRATGVRYVDPLGREHTQEATTVVVCAYTWETVRLLFLSSDAKHPGGLGNATGQLGKHLMVKNFAHVDGWFPDTVFNRHTGPAAQGVVLDDYLSADFDSWGEGGFLGGSTLGAENQFLPIQIARESLPPNVPRWGSGYREHLKGWQHLGVVRLQPESLSYDSNFIDVDPHRRDRSGLGIPVVRATYDIRANELRQAAFFESKSAEVLRAMGATKTWAGPSFTGVGSSHDLGGCRMADDPTAGVVDRTLKVHDTEGLYVFSGAVLPTCPGINPTHTLWALVSKAADELVARLRAGEEG